MFIASSCLTILGWAQEECIHDGERFPLACLKRASSFVFCGVQILRVYYHTVTQDHYDPALPYTKSRLGLIIGFLSDDRGGREWDTFCTCK